MKLIRIASNILWVLLAVFAIYTVVPGQPLYPAQISLDESWRIALQVAFEKGLIFGKDFLFTYGPLGFLAARLNDPDTAPMICIYDHFVILQFCMLAITLFRQSRSLLSALIFLMLMVSLGNAHYYLDPAIILYLFSTFWLYKDKQSSHQLIFSLAATDALLALFIKSNLGLAGIIQILAVTLHSACIFKSRARSVWRLAVVLLSLFLCSIALKVDLIGYLKGAAHIANGFNDAMYLDVKDAEYLIWCLVTLCLLSIALLANIICRSDILLTISCAGFAFLLFKQAYVRADEHVYVFFDYILAPFALLTFFSSGQRRLFHGFLVSIVGGIALYQNPPAKEFLYNTSARIENYYLSLNDTKEPDFSAAPLGSEIIKRIGQQEVDIMPDNISLLYHSQLNYAPRPVIQSYAAYDSYLDQLNAQFIKQRGAKFVLFSNGCIDHRYCPHDETESKIALIEQYNLDYQDGGFFLLKRKEEPTPFSKHSIATGSYRFGQRLTFKNNGFIQLLVIKADYSVRGKVWRLLFQPPRLKITIKSANSKATYRAIVPILQGGVIANLNLNTDNALLSFFKHDISSIEPIEFIRLHSETSHLFPKRFDYEIFELRPQTVNK